MVTRNTYKEQNQEQDMHNEVAKQFVKAKINWKAKKNNNNQ